jgi:hypothetical protein
MRTRMPVHAGWHANPDLYYLKQKFFYFSAQVEGSVSAYRLIVLKPDLMMMMFT